MCTVRSTLDHDTLTLDEKKTSSSNKLMLAAVAAIYVSIITFITTTISYITNGLDSVLLSFKY